MMYLVLFFSRIYYTWYYYNTRGMEKQQSSQQQVLRAVSPPASLCPYIFYDISVSRFRYDDECVLYTFSISPTTSLFFLPNIAFLFSVVWKSCLFWISLFARWYRTPAAPILTSIPVRLEGVGRGGVLASRNSGVRRYFRSAVLKVLPHVAYIRSYITHQPYGRARACGALNAETVRPRMIYVI